MLTRLSELEYAAVRAVDQPEIQTSQLYMQHIQDTSLDAHSDSAFALTVAFMLKLLSQEFPDPPSFTASLKQIEHRVNSNFISTTRRLELELMHAGKVNLTRVSVFTSQMPNNRE